MTIRRDGEPYPYPGYALLSVEAEQVPSGRPKNQ